MGRTPAPPNTLTDVAEVSGTANGQSLNSTRGDAMKQSASANEMSTLASPQTPIMADVYEPPVSGHNEVVIAPTFAERREDEGESGPVFTLTEYLSQAPIHQPSVQEHKTWFMLSMFLFILAIFYLSYCCSVHYSCPLFVPLIYIWFTYFLWNWKV